MRHDALLPDDDETADGFARDTPYQREGLPPGFRMRHDAHYVDQLTTRSTAPHVRLIPLRDIDAAPPAGRDLEVLTRSIAKHGVLQPLLVRPRGGRFDVIAGAGRLAAAAASGLVEVPCLVHHVDDARARALAEADNLHAVVAAEPATGGPAVTGTALGELSHSFGAIGSCLHLLADRDLPLRDRVALDLVRTEIHRASRLVGCLRALSPDAVRTDSQLSLKATVDRAVDGFAPECRLSGATIAVEGVDGPCAVRADHEWIAVAVAAALGGMLALVQGATTPALTVQVSATGSRASLMLEISQQAVTVPAWALGRFFDQAWTDRPGGYQAASELAAARRIAEWHGGGAEVLPGERGGCRLVLLFPTA